MKYNPHGHQALATAHILDVPRCNLWEDPGMGKTSASLSAIEILLLTGSKFLPALVLAPKRVARRVWTDEARKWDHLHGIKVVSLVGTPAQRLAALKVSADVYVINYENIEWLVDVCGDKWPFGMVLADESTKLKSFRIRAGGKRARALSKICDRTGRWVNLTGTPSPNGLIDLWGQNWFLDGGTRLGRTYGAFKDRWFVENVYARTLRPRPNAQEEISAALEDITLSIQAPPGMEPTHNHIYVELPAKARALYEDLETELVATIDGDTVVAGTAAAVSMKCLQVCAGALYQSEEGYHEIHKEKLDALADLHDEMGRKPLMVAYHFKHDLDRLMKRFPRGRALKTAKDEDQWNEERIPMLFVHPQSAGHGLNLQYGGATLAFFTHTWGLEGYMQVIERIGPMRQKQAGINRRVTVHHILAADTIDEAVMARLTSKLSVQDALRQRLNKGV